MSESITLQTNDSIVESGDLLGRISFAASNESGIVARSVSAQIIAEAEDSFTVSSNPSSLVVYLSPSGSLEEKLKISSDGQVSLSSILFPDMTLQTSAGLLSGDNISVLNNDLLYVGSGTNGVYSFANQNPSQLALQTSGEAISARFYGGDQYLQVANNPTYPHFIELRTAAANNNSNSGVHFAIQGTAKSALAIVQCATAGSGVPRVVINGGTTQSDLANPGDGALNVKSVHEEIPNLVIHKKSGGTSNLTEWQDSGTEVATMNNVGTLVTREIKPSTTNIVIGTPTTEPTITGHTFSTIIGDQAGNGATGANRLIGIGHRAGKSASSLIYSVAVGEEAGASNSGTTGGVFIGYFAGKSTTDVDESVFIGSYPGLSAQGNHNIGIGFSAFRSGNGTNNIEIVTDGPSTSIIGTNNNKLNIERTIIGDTSSKRLAIGNVGASNLSPSGTLHIVPKETTDRALVISSGAFVQDSIPHSDTPTAEDATVTLDLRQGNYFNISLDADVTKFEFTNASRGQRFILRITQHASLPKTVSWTDVDYNTSGGAATVRWANGLAPSMTSTSSKTDIYGFLCTNTAGTDFDGFVIGQDF